MISPSSSISNLSNSNKKFKSDDSDAASVATKPLLNGDSLKASLNNKNELNDVTNSENNNSEYKLNVSEKMNGSHKNSVNDKMCNEPMDEEHVENGSAKARSVKAETPNDEDNDCEMIDETEIKPDVKPALKKEEVTIAETKPHMNGIDNGHAEPEAVNMEAGETEEEELNRELKALSKLVELDTNNNSEMFRSKRSLLKQVKANKLKQLQIDLKNEEAKLILLKRLYYSQRMTQTPLTQQQQLLKQQQLAQQQKNMAMKKPGMTGQMPQQQGMNPNRSSIMGNNNNQRNQMVNQQNQMLRGGQMNSNKPVVPGAGITNNGVNSPSNMQRNLSGVAGAVNAMNKPAMRQMANSGAASPANRMNTQSPVNANSSKAYPPGAASPSIQNSLASGSNPSTISPNSAFSPKLPEPKPVISTQQVSQLVRKELEKSLAQIEFPKPPAQDIYFIPNTNSSDFLYCLGLEEVAKCVQEHLIHKQLKAETKEQKENGTDSKENDANKLTKADTITEVVYEYPLFCAQCTTDFSPVWRTDKNGVNLCERCLKQLEKKQIKTEHNARLKQAFLKAVKDKEIFEKQLLAEQQKALEQQRQQRAAAQAQAQERAASMAAERAAAAAERAAAERVSAAAEQQARREREQAVAMAQQQQQNSHHSSSQQQRMNSSNSQNRGPGNASQGSRISSGGGQNNMSRQQQQQMQQRRSMPAGAMNQNKVGMNHGGPPQGKAGMNNMSSSMKSANSVGRPMNNSGNHGQNHSMQQKPKMDGQRPSGMSQQQQQQRQQQRQSTGGQSNNASAKSNNSQGFSSRQQNNHNNTNNADSDSAQAALQAQAAQLQLAAAFANTPALAAFAQQQHQQQQQAAILQRLMANANNPAGMAAFNPLQSLGLQSPAATALNYLNMFPNQKQWKNP